mmetsp:Transcript_15749/g.17777  ORF Transcript_15749/g.17777 Transcript_15749/m.17777 type:complete len:452 (-) Transcript_15749:74-1429(-)
MTSLSGGDVQELLREHGERIDGLQNLLLDDLPREGRTADGILIDDLFFLRYILSNLNKDDEKIAEKIRFNLEYRASKTGRQRKWLLELGRECADLGVDFHSPVESNTRYHPLEEDISKYLYSAYTGDLQDGEPVSVVRVGMSDLSSLLETHDRDDVVDFLMYEKEKIFRTCDARTRMTGQIVKAVTVMDMADLNPFGKRFSRDFITKCIGKSSNIASKMYPQMQLYTVVINASGSASMLYGLVTSVLPKSAAKKFIKCGVKGSTSGQDAIDCPFIRTYGMDAIPPFLGGRGPTPEALLHPSERDGQVPMTKMRIKARSRKSLKINIEDVGTLVQFESEIDAHHVLVSAEVISATEEHFKMQFHMPPTELRDTNGLVDVKWILQDIGTLVITFDNTFSRLTPKTVWHRIQVIPPSEREGTERSSFWEPTESNYNPFSGITSAVSDYNPCTIM